MGGCLPSLPRRYVFGAAVNVNARGVKMVWETEEEKKSPIGMICRTGICMGRARESSERFNEVCLQHKLHYANALQKFTKPQVPLRDSCLR